MNMKRFICASFLCGLMVISLAGCGSGGGGEGSTPAAGSYLPSGSDGGSTVETATSAETATSGVATSTGVAKLSWDPPEAGVARFKVYFGTSPGAYTSSFDAGLTPSYTLSGLSPGIYYFAVTASDSSGNESGYSNEVSKTIS